MKEESKVYAKIKQVPEDFIVEEVGEGYECKVSREFLPNVKVNLSGLELENVRDFLWCELEKKEVDHFSAVKELSEKLGVNVCDIGYGGTKDKFAWTVQRISIFKPNLEKLIEFSSPNISLKNFKWEKRKIKLGFLKGNRFRIVLRDIDKKDSIKILSLIRKKDWFANYFGEQRFGKEGNNFNIGKYILKGNFEGAVLEILKDYSENVTREMRNVLYRDEKDFLGALRRFPRKNMLMYIHSVQSKIFNEILSTAIDEGLDFTKKGQENCLLFGFKSRFSTGRLGEIEQEVLKRNGLVLEDFDVGDISYLRMKGSFRKAIVRVGELEVDAGDDEVFVGAKKIILKFVLPSGVYATTFLAEFFSV